MTGEEVRQVAAVAHARALPWAGTTDYDDIVGQCYYEACVNYRRAERTGKCAPLVAAKAGARRGPAAWWACWFGDRAHPGKHQQEAHLLLEELVVPGPEAALLAQLDAQMPATGALWARGEAVWTAREREVMECLLVLGQSQAAAAAALGIGAASVNLTYHRGLRRLRAALEE